MRDRHFMEDENELPFLVWEDRDDKSSGSSYYRNKSKNNKKKLDDILNSMRLPASQHAILKNKLISLLNAKDCVNLTVDVGLGEYMFIFTRQNEYVKTTDEFEFDPSCDYLDRIFRDCYTEHNHDGLIGNPRFKDMIRKTGMEFTGCRGGYVTDYSRVDDDFTFRDEIEVKVVFKVGSTKRLYDLDLDRMELSEKYFKINI